ncbi:MAG: flagellin [Bdellovibrionota bacterium]
MGLRISTNVASIAAQRQLGKSQDRFSHAIRALASGSRLVDPGDDAAGFAIAENLRGQAASLKAAQRNAESAVGLIQVAEGGLSEQNNILVRLRELAVQAASDTVGDEERKFLDVEFQQLTKELDRIAETTRYGNKMLLTGGNEEFEFQLGSGGTENDLIRYRMDADTRSTTLGISGLSVEDQDSARGLLTELDDALLKVAGARASFGAVQSRLNIASDNLNLQHENVVSARSRIADADVAHEIAEMTSQQVQQQLGLSVLAQANAVPAAVLKIL